MTKEDNLKKAIAKLVTLLHLLCIEECVPPTKIFGHRELKGTGWTLQKGSKRLRKTCPGMSVLLCLHSPTWSVEFASNI